MQPPREASANERGEKVEGFKISKSSHLFMSLIVAFIPGGGGPLGFILNENFTTLFT